MDSRGRLKIQCLAYVPDRRRKAVLLDMFVNIVENELLALNCKVSHIITSKHLFVYDIIISYMNYDVKRLFTEFIIFAHKIFNMELVMEKQGERLQKYMARAGVGSRRHCEQLIINGRVCVDGVTVSELGTRVAEGSKVELDGVTLNADQIKKYILMYKPTGCVTSVKDQFGRMTVMDIIKSEPARLYPVGRLDYNTTGLLLLTNDGEFAYKAAHPKSEIEKLYEAAISGKADDEMLERLRAGVVLDDGFKTSRAGVWPGKIKSTVFILIHEGHNRQVRRMFEAVGLKVLGLRRVAIGGLDLTGLMPGEWKYITLEEALRIEEKCRKTSFMMQN
jgi:23S rRNA pseudouridine2605 synthase